MSSSEKKIHAIDINEWLLSASNGIGSFANIQSCSDAVCKICAVFEGIF